MRYVPDLIPRIYSVMPIWSRSLASTMYGVLKYGHETTPEFRKYLSALEESQWWPLSRLQELQAERLKSLIRHAAAHVPYYRRLFAEHGVDPASIQTPGDLGRLPTLNKKTVHLAWKDLLAENVDTRSLRKESTSGTTGTPLTVYMGHDSYLHSRAAQWLHHAWGGYTHKEWMGILAGYAVVPPTRNHSPYWVTNYAGKQVHFSTLHLKANTFREYVDKMQSSRLQFLLGYPSAIGLLARYMVEHGITYNVRAVFLSSEPLYHWQEEAIGKAFGCPIFNYFGQAEKAATATSCRDHTSLHLNMEIGIAELLPSRDEADGDRVIVATSLMNYAMPLIRYELGDVTKEKKGVCSCGRQHQRIGPIETVVDNYLLLPDGSLLSPSLLYFPFQKVIGVEASQIVQEDISHVVVNVVPGEQFTEVVSEQIAHDVRGIVGPGVSVTVRTVPEIPRTGNAKFRFVISKVPRSQPGA
jgi:phenylacetate-CoA ligase